MIYCSYKVYLSFLGLRPRMNKIKMSQPKQINSADELINELKSMSCYHDRIPDRAVILKLKDIIQNVNSLYIDEGKKVISVTKTR